MSEIEHTMGVEQLTWYRDSAGQPHRIKITYPDGRYPLSAEQAEMIDGEPGDLHPALIEMFGLDSFAKMGIRTPEDMMDVAEVFRTAATLWRHEIGECGCEADADAPENVPEMPEMPEGFNIEEVPGGIIVTMAGIPLADLFGIGEPESDDAMPAEEEPASSPTEQ